MSKLKKYESVGKLYERTNRMRKLKYYKNLINIFEQNVSLHVYIMILFLRLSIEHMIYYLAREV